MHTFCKLTQTSLDTLGFLQRNGRFNTQNLHLHLSWHHRNRVLWKRIVISANLRWSRIDILCKLGLHLLNNHLIAHHGHHLFTYFATGLAEILLHLLLATNLRNVIIHSHIHLATNGRLIYLYRVQLCLMQKQLLDSQLLWNDAIRITRNRLSLVLRTQTLLLHFTTKNSLFTNYPNNLVYHIVLSNYHFARKPITKD